MKDKTLKILIIFTLLFHHCAILPVLAVNKTGNSIQAANKFAQIAHNAYSKQDFLNAAINYEKAYQANPVNVYKENSITAYLSYANNLAIDEDYENALKYANKVLSIDKDNASAKELVADIYYGKGADFYKKGNIDNAILELQKAEKLAANPEQQAKIKEALAKIEHAKKNNLVPMPYSSNSSNNSIPQTVSLLEKKLYGKQNSTLPLIDRVSKLEKDALGQNYNAEGLVARIERLKFKISPELMAQPAQNQQSNSDYSENNYIREIMEQSMGKVSIFGKMPISIYIDYSKVKTYRKLYKDVVKEAFEEWSKVSNNNIKFKYVYEPQEADFKVVWQGEFEDFPWQPTLDKTDISAEKDKMKYRKANAVVQTGSVLAMLAGGLMGVPVIGGVGSIGSSVASPYLSYKGMNKQESNPDIKINTNITKEMTDEQAKAKIKQIAMHQIGHALGIYAHSNNPNDIMYKDFSVYSLSQRDINTINEIYKPKNSK